jgi:hypothetical protein
MGAVLRFPTERVRGALIQSLMPEPAEILILPQSGSSAGGSATQPRPKCPSRPAAMPSAAASGAGERRGAEAPFQMKRRVHF